PGSACGWPCPGERSCGCCARCFRSPCTRPLPTPSAAGPMRSASTWRRSRSICCCFIWWSARTGFDPARCRGAGPKTTTAVRKQPDHQGRLLGQRHGRTIMATVGFIGLGNMGGPMAVNLIRAGHKVVGLDLSEAARARLKEAGGTAVEQIAEAVGMADAVVTMLPAGKHVREVYTGEGGVLAHARPGTLLIDSSTIDVESARLVAAAAEAAGMIMVDAPVSGGVGGAAAGTLTFMVGGSDAAFAAAKPYLEAMGKTIVHAGGPGNGQAAKICNNMILGISMIAVSEAFVLAERLGLDHQKLFDISSTAS